MAGLAGGWCWLGCCGWRCWGWVLVGLEGWGWLLVGLEGLEVLGVLVEMAIPVVLVVLVV